VHRRIASSAAAAHPPPRGARAMSTEPERPDTCTKPRAESERTPDLLTDRDAEERADIKEDRRRQRELDDGELGGEA
jgi:hypothetical protein